MDRVEQEHALDRRVDRARENQLANRAASVPGQSEDWQAARERQLTDALDKARMQVADRVEQEHALDRRVDRARENQLASRATSVPGQSEDWQAARERQLTRALDKARTQIEQDVAQERAFDRRRETPGETSRAAAAPEPERGADRPPERDRRLSAVQDQPRARTPEVSNPQDALDQRVARAREQALEENRAARKREREQELSALRERPRDRVDALDRRQQRVRDKLDRANRTARKIERMTDSTLGRAERVADGLRQLDKSLQGFDEARDDAGAGENIEGLGKLRSGLDKVLPLADKVEAPLRRARDRQETWQAKRESAREKLRQFKTFQDSNRRKLGVDSGTIDDLTALRDKARELWSDDKDKKKDAQKKQKTLAERAKDLDDVSETGARAAHGQTGRESASRAAAGTRTEAPEVGRRRLSRLREGRAERMSTPGSFVAGTIEDILVSLAQGIRDAQERLNQLEPFDEYGRPKAQYYLPHLDFTLKINAVETKTTETGAVTPAASSAGGFVPAKRVASFAMVRETPIKFALANPSRSSTSTTNEVYSTISGRFVAVPPNEGMPQIALAVTSTKDPSGTGKQTIRVASTYAAGGPVRGATVEFNADPVSTAALNELSNPVALDNTSIFQNGAVVTDESGVATTVVNLTAVPAAIAKLLVVANLGPVRASILITVAG